MIQFIVYSKISMQIYYCNYRSLLLLSLLFIIIVFVVAVLTNVQLLFLEVMYLV